MTIYKLGDNLDTANFRLSNPVPNQGGTYFSKLLINNNDDHFYIQTPKCKTKQGIMKTGKKKYTDLLLSELNSDFVEIITKIEEKLQDLIYSKHEIWFANTDLEMEDIQNSFVSPVKVYKGKNYLMRVNLNSLRSNIDNAIPIFNEKEMEKSLEDITQESDIISILEILGIKFSQRYFQIEINVKQIMIMENAPIFNNCLIKKDNEKLFEVKDADAQANAGTQANAGAQANSGAKANAGAQANADADADADAYTDTDVETDIESDDEKDGVSAVKEKDLEEFEVSLEDFGSVGETVELKKPDQIYMDLYTNALEKAKQAKKTAIDAYLVAKNIKDTYAINIDDDEEYDLI